MIHLSRDFCNVVQWYKLHNVAEIFESGLCNSYSIINTHLSCVETAHLFWNHHRLEWNPCYNYSIANINFLMHYNRLFHCELSITPESDFSYKNLCIICSLLIRCNQTFCFKAMKALEQGPSCNNSLFDCHSRWYLMIHLPM